MKEYVKNLIKEDELFQEVSRLTISDKLKTLVIVPVLIMMSVGFLL